MIRRLNNQRSVSFSIHSSLSSSERKSIPCCDISICKQSGSLTNLSKLSLTKVSSENIHGSNLSLSTLSSPQARIPLTFSQLNADDKFLRDVAAMNDTNDDTFDDSISPGNENDDDKTLPSW